jgi:hypothetical protein
MGPPRDLRNTASTIQSRSLLLEQAIAYPPEEIMLSIIMLVSNKQAS